MKIKGQLDLFFGDKECVLGYFIVRTVEGLICHFIHAFYFILLTVLFKIDALIVIRQDSLLNINSSGTIKHSLKHWTQIKGVKESCE